MRALAARGSSCCGGRVWGRVSVWFAARDRVLPAGHTYAWSLSAMSRQFSRLLGRVGTSARVSPWRQPRQMSAYIQLRAAATSSSGAGSVRLRPRPEGARGGERGVSWSGGQRASVRVAASSARRHPTAARLARARESAATSYSGIRAGRRHRRASEQQATSDADTTDA